MSRLPLILAGLALLVIVVFLWPDRPGQPPLEPQPESPPAAVVEPEQQFAEPEPEPERRVAENPVPDTAPCAQRQAQYVKPSRQEVTSTVQRAVELLRSTRGQDYALAAAMLSSGIAPGTTVDLLNELGGERTTDPLVLWSGLSICNNHDTVSCDYTAIEENVRMNHSANGAFWAAVAGHEIGAGNPPAAREALVEALAAPYFDGYFAEQYMLLDRAFAATTNWSAAERALRIMEHVSTMPPGFRNLMKHCETSSAGDWMSLCDDLVEKLAEADELMARTVAYEMKGKLLRSRGQTDEANALRERRGAVISDVFEDEQRAKRMFNVLLNDEVLLSDFLQSVESYGEIPALEQLARMVDELQQEEDYDECKFIANPYLEF